MLAYGHSPSFGGLVPHFSHCRVNWIRFRCGSRMDSKSCSRNGREIRLFLARRFCRSCWGRTSVRIPGGALHTGGRGCTLSVVRGVEMEVPDEMALIIALTRRVAAPAAVH